MRTEDLRMIIVGAAWYGDWAKGFYRACIRRGLRAEIVYNNSLPAPLGGSTESVTSFFEKTKLRVKQAAPRLFGFLKRIRQLFSELEILFRVMRAELQSKKIAVVFTWTPGSYWILEKLRAHKKVFLVLWLGEPTVRDATWEPKFDYFRRVFIVDDGKWVSVLSEKNRKKVDLLPLASDDTIFFPVSETPERYHSDVVFVGKYLPSRARSLARIKDYNLSIYGYGWEAGFEEFPWLRKACKGGITTVELNNAYNGAKIAVGTLGMPKDPFTTATMRTFDIALSGTFQVCEAVYLSKKLFGNSVGFFEDDAELKRLVDYYLAHKDEREACAARSREIAMRYTYAEAARKISEAASSPFS